MPRQKTMRISTETICNTLYFRRRDALYLLNAKYLRHSHRLRHIRGTTKIENGISNHKRFRHTDNGRPPGHWEGEVVSGTRKFHIATLADRKSRSPDVGHRLTR